jgi:cytosine deaminase
VNAARVMGLDGYGLDVGCRADAVLLQARSPVEAIRLRAARLVVLRGGEVIAQSEPAQARLRLGGRAGVVDWTLRR